MAKIKLNLVSGAIVEKPLICAFSSNDNSYVVLDNEINGSMGLPIILVSKLDNNKLIKIVDQNEWQVVKEYLKNIIAGGQINFIPISNEIAADDIYYTQLTLPIPSFDALKNAYKVEETNNNESNEIGVMDINLNQDIVTPEVSQQPAEPVSVESTPEVTPVSSNIEITPEVAVQPSEEVKTVEETPTPVTNEPVVDESKPIIDINSSVETPSVQETTISDVEAKDLEEQMPIFNVGSDTVNEDAKKEYEPEISPTPIIDANIPGSTTEKDMFKEQKEAFMQACENMFDALVHKFEKELENRK